jgi:micrococcal nuclease
MIFTLFKYIRRLLYLALTIIIIFATIKKYKSEIPLGISGNTANTTGENFVVTHVVDGDTFVLDTKERVRLIGVDTPEKFISSKLKKDAERSKKDIKTIQKLGEQSSSYVRKMVEGKKVILKTDKYSAKQDKYGRLLRYVYLEDGTCINSKIIEDGYGNAYTSFKFEKMDEYRQLEREARTNNRGLWKDGL